MKSVKFYSGIFDTSERRIRKLCEQGRVFGAEKVGKTWILPDDAKIKRASRRGPPSKLVFAD